MNRFKPWFLHSACMSFQWLIILSMYKKKKLKSSELKYWTNVTYVRLV
jgi:hypothetical protein